MPEEDDATPESTPGHRASDAKAHRPADDEQRSRAHIEQTGEPERDRLGNAEGAS